MDHLTSTIAPYCWLGRVCRDVQGVVAFERYLAHSLPPQPTIQELATWAKVRRDGLAAGRSVRLKEYSNRRLDVEFSVLTENFVKTKAANPRQELVARYHSLVVIQVEIDVQE